MQILLPEPESLPHLTLLVHPQPARLEAECDRLRTLYDWPTLSIGQALAQGLLNLPPRRWPSAVQAILQDALAQFGDNVILCTDLSLLFDPALGVNPLVLLQQTARSARLIVLWPGSYENATLACASSDHAHYRTWSNPDVFILPLR